MHDTPSPNAHPDPAARRSSVVPLATAGVVKPGTTDHVPTVLGENPLARSVPVAFDLPVGATLGQFEVVGPLGAGGMATVFKARDLSLGREVALKILPPAFAADPDAVTRFKHEARAAAKLNHDHVARVFFFGEDRGLHYIAFEFVEGFTLRELIDRHGPISPADAVRYMLDTTVGLQHAAEKGVVHRDVKPSNIIITPGGRAKLIDMGLARSVDPHSVNGQVTQSGMTLGTFDYISPEQAIDPRRADIRSDIYSLGCTFYHALTGRTPVPDGNAARKLAAHQTESPTDPRLINSAVPDELAGVLDRMMAKLPAHRQQSAADLIDDLNRVAAVMGLKTVVSDLAANSAPARPPTGGERNWIGLGSLAVAVVALAVVVLVLAVTNTGPQSTDLPAQPWNDTPRTPPPTELIANDPGPVRAPTQANVNSTAELVKALKDNVPKVTLAAGTYDLSGEAGFVLSGKLVELDSPDGGAVVKLSAPPRGDKVNDPRTGSLTFSKCDTVRLRGVRFDITQTDAPKGVGLLLHEVATAEVVECRFVVSSPSATDGSVLTFTRTGTVTARHAFFQSRGWAAVELPGGTKADFIECGFIAGRAAVEVTAGDTPATVSTNRVTFLLNNSAAAVSVTKGGRCDLTAGHTLFAAPTPTDPGMMTDLDRKPVVLRAVDSPDTNTAIIPDDTPSAVYRVDPPASASPTVLTSPPWAVAPKFDPDNPFTQLELNAKLPALRVGKTDILGVRLWTDRRAMYSPFPLPPLVRPNEAVWFPKMDPAEKASYPENVYADLRDALNALKGKGTLLVRGRGVMAVPSVVLDAGTRVITIRPDEDSAPVLTPSGGRDRLETTLFRLEAGELKLDGLQFNVKPGQRATAATVVSMSGGKRCEFKRCVVTLDEGSGENSAAVSLADVGKVMVVKEFTDQPSVTFDTCLIRGRGSVVRAEAAISATISLTHVGVITEGAAAFDFGPPTRPASLALNLTSTTAALAAPLLDLRTARRPDDKPVLRFDLHADNCLFAAQDKTTDPLVRVLGLDPAAAEKPLTWTTSGGNRFDGWTTFAEVQTDETAEPKKWDAAEWRKWSGEADTPAVSLKKPPVSKATAKPTDLAPAEATSAGASLKPLAGLFPE
jgi:hypothetical protein